MHSTTTAIQAGHLAYWTTGECIVTVTRVGQEYDAGAAVVYCKYDPAPYDTRLCFLQPVCEHEFADTLCTRLAGHDGRHSDTLAGK